MVHTNDPRSTASQELPGAPGDCHIEQLAHGHEMLAWGHGLCGSCQERHIPAALPLYELRDDEGRTLAAGWTRTPSDGKVHLTVFADSSRDTARPVPVLRALRQRLAEAEIPRVVTTVTLESSAVLDAFKEAGYHVEELLQCGGSAELTLRVGLN